jgi:tetratricopeptide (TPR) repeat protein
MTEEPKNKSFGDLLRATISWITITTGFISAAIGFIKVVKGEAAIASWVSLIAGLLVLYAFLLYLMLAKRSSALVLSDKNQGSSRFTYDKKIRRYALIGVTVLTVLVTIGTMGYFYYDSIRPKQIIILVADFGGPDAEKYRVTETLIRQLRASIEDFSDVQIKALGSVINERDGSEAARREGRERKAAIVLWGWYGKTAEKVVVSASVEPLETPKFLSLRAKGSLSLLPVEDLESFSLQIGLSSEMSYLTLLTIGLARLDVEDYDGAILRLSRAISQPQVPDQLIDPSQAYFFRARAFFFKRDSGWKSSVEDLDKAVTIKPEFPEAYVLRALVRLSHGQSDSALADCAEALKYKPEYPFANILKGLAFELRLDQQSARVAYREAVRPMPNDERDKVIRAFAFLRMGDFAQTNSELEEIDKSDNDKLRAYLLISSLVLLQGQDFVNSLLAVNTAIDLKPQLLDGYAIRANIFVAAGRFDRAIDDCNHILAKDSTDDSALLCRGQAYAGKKDLDSAIADYNTFIKRNPDQLTGFFFRASCFQDKGDLDAAVHDFSMAILLSPSAVPLYLTRGYVYYLKGDIDSALSDFNQAVFIDPKDADSFSYRAEAYAKANLYDQAIADLGRAIALSPNDAQLYGRRCRLYVKKDDFDRLAEDASLLIARFPENPYGYIFQSVAKFLRMKALLEHSDKPEDLQMMKDLAESAQSDIERAKSITEASISLSDRNAQIRGFK